MKTHRLKTWIAYYDEVAAGRKTFEIRENDRDYAVGDHLVLMRWDPEQGCATGEEMTVLVTYLTDAKAFAALQPGRVCMSIRPVEAEDADGAP